LVSVAVASLSFTTRYPATLGFPVLERLHDATGETVALAMVREHAGIQLTSGSPASQSGRSDRLLRVYSVEKLG
jgi:DNA-binding IclR family transcriptional regulator